jgi:hypothetical protein
MRKTIKKKREEIEEMNRNTVPLGRILGIPIVWNINHNIHSIVWVESGIFYEAWF